MEELLHGLKWPPDCLAFLGLFWVEFVTDHHMKLVATYNIFPTSAHMLQSEFYRARTSQNTKLSQSCFLKRVVSQFGFVGIVVGVEHLDSFGWEPG